MPEFSPWLAPDLYSQQQANTRQQALAQALLSRGIAGTNADVIDAGHFKVARSPLEGLSSLAQVYYGNKRGEDLDKQSTDINQKYAEILRGGFKKKPLNIEGDFSPEDRARMQAEYDQTAPEGDMVMKGMKGDQAWQLYNMNPEAYTKALIDQNAPSSGQFGSTPLYFSNGKTTVLGFKTPNGMVQNALTGEQLDDSYQPYMNAYQQSQINPNIQQSIANAKASGSAAGEISGAAAATLPKVDSDTEFVHGLVGKVKTHPGLDIGTGATSILANIPGTEGRGFKVLVDQIKSSAFQQAIPSMRGLGSLSNAEGSKVEAALARLDQAQTKQDFLQALDEYDQSVERLRRVAHEEAGHQIGNDQQTQNQPTQPQILKFNPATGKLE